MLDNRKLISTLAKLQSDYVGGLDAAVIFDQLLSTIVVFTRSQCGFIGEAQLKSESAEFLKVLAVNGAAWPRENLHPNRGQPVQGRPFANFDTHIEAVMARRLLTVVNRVKSDSRVGDMSEGEPALKRFLGIPFFAGKKLLGIIGLANRPLDYDEELIAALEFVPSIIASIVVSEQTRIERNEKETELRLSENRFRNLIRDVHVGVILIAPDGRFLQVNRNAEQMLGFTETQLKSRASFKDGWDVVDRAGNPMSPEVLPIARALSGGRSVRGEIIGILRAGSHERLWLLVSAEVQVESGKIVGVVCSFIDITDNVKTQHALEQSERLLRGTAEIAHIGGWELKLETMELQWSTEVYRIHGLPPSRMLTLEEALEFYPADARLLVKSAFEEGIRQGRSWDLEVPFISSDSSERWVRILGQVDVGKGGGSRVFGCFQDVTERMAAEYSFRVNQERWDLAVRASGIGVWDWDITAGRLEWDANMFRLFNVEPESFKNEYIDFARCVHPEDLNRVEKEINFALENRGEFNCEYRVVWSNGGTRYVAARSSAFYGRDGKPYRMIGVCLDITERNLAEAVKELNNRKIRAIIDNVLDGIISIDEYGVINSCNPAAEKMFGYTSQMMIGKCFYDLMEASAAELYRRGLAAYLETGVDQLIGRGHEVTGVHAGGAPFPMLLSLVGMPFDQKRVGVGDKPTKRNFIATIQNLTQLKRSEDALRRSHKMDAIGQLSGGIAHDFNNLLGIIIGNLELLERTLLGNQSAMKRVQSALRAAMRGNDLTQRLLAFARQRPMKKEEVDINEIVRGMNEMLCRSLTANISVDTRLSEVLWPVFIDPGDLEDAILNLSINARDAMPKGGKLLIATSNEILEDDVRERDPHFHPGEYVMLSISDSGTGMSRDTMDRMFEPFYTTKPHGKGTGLGTSMVYGFVTRSGGHIRVYSELGLGTTIRIFLPRATTNADVPISEIRNSDRSLPQGCETILVVDDEIDLAETAAEHLVSLGYTAIVADTADRAIQLLGKHKGIHLLFSDVIMPGQINGFELARRAREIQPDLRVLLTSGFVAGLGDDQAETALLNCLLTKPYSRTDLAFRIRLTLDDIGV